MKKQKTVAIIGAGFAGSFAAFLLSKKFKVVIIEKNPSKIEEKGPRLLTSKFFAIDPIFKTKKFRKDAVINEISKALIVSKHNHAQITFSSPETVINPEKFRDFLLNRAFKENAKLLKAEFLNFSLEENVEDIEEKIIVSLKEQGKIKKITADFLIDCSGAKSKISRQLQNKFELRPAIQAEILSRKKLEKGLWAAYLDVSSHNLIWLFPSDGTAVVSYTTINSMPQAAINRRFRQILKRIGTKKILKIEEATIPIWNKKINYGKGRVFLLGDSASQVKASTFGGIVPSFRAAKILERIISKNQDAKEYQKQLYAISKELALHSLVCRLLSKISDKDADYFIEIIKENKKFIESRDELSSNINFSWILSNLFNPRFLFIILKILNLL